MPLKIGGTSGGTELKFEKISQCKQRVKQYSLSRPLRHLVEKIIFKNKELVENAVPDFLSVPTPVPTSCTAHIP